MIKKTSKLVPGDYARYTLEDNFKCVLSATPPKEGISVNEYWRVDFKDSVGNWYPADDDWFIEDQPKLYRASELKPFEWVKFSNEYLTWDIFRQVSFIEQISENDYRVGVSNYMDGYTECSNDLIWQKQDQPVQPPTLTNEQLENVIIQGLSNLVVFAANLDKQEPTDQADFEFYIRQTQNIIMARLMWRQMKALQDKVNNV